MNNYREISEDNIDSLIEECWASTRVKVENGHPLSSEKTLCFIFAMEVVTRTDFQNLTIDFENQCYENLQGNSKYLDLLFYTNENYKVAIEFKLPTRSANGNSNQTQTRESVYRDLARLNYLKQNHESFRACYFIMATDEDSYLNNQSLRISTEFKTKHSHNICSNNNLVAEGLSLHGVECNFMWHGIERNNTGKKYIRSGNYSWLKKIKA